MTCPDYTALLPLLITAYSGAVLMLITAFWRSARGAYGLTLFSLVCAFCSIFIALPVTPRTITPLICIDSYALFFVGLIIAASILVTLLHPQYLDSRQKHGESIYVLIIFATLGMETMVASCHFASFFLGFEILSVSLYGLIGYTQHHKPSLEAAIKYFILAATASAFLLFGIALIYLDTGTMDFHKLAPMLASVQLSVTTLFGLVLVLAAIGFKLAFAPFHMWSPDVYQGSPAPVTALIASGSKCAAFAALLRLFSMVNLNSSPGIFLVLSALAFATMFAGNLLALLQTNVKRLLAYSSIAHMGYLLIPLIAGRGQAPSSIAFYLAAYSATTITAFGIITILSTFKKTGDMEELEDYRGLAQRSPALTAIMTIALLSLAGIPLTAGFFAKFYIFSAAVQSGMWALLIVGVVNSGLSAYYYMRVVVTMYTRIDKETSQLPEPDIASQIALGVALAIILSFGIYPSPLIQLADIVTRTLRF